MKSGSTLPFARDAGDEDGERDDHDEADRDERECRDERPGAARHHAVEEIAGPLAEVRLGTPALPEANIVGRDRRGVLCRADRRTARPVVAISLEGVSKVAEGLTAFVR